MARVRPVAGRDEVEIAGRLVDMADTDRGMLGLYLSTQPLAALNDAADVVGGLLNDTTGRAV